MDLKFCVDIVFLRSTIALGETVGVGTYDGLTNPAFRTYLDNEAAKSCTKVTFDSLRAPFKKSLRMDMLNKDISSR